MTSTATEIPTLDPDRGVEVVGISIYGELVCVRQGGNFFSLKVGDLDEAAEPEFISEEEAGQIRRATAVCTNAGTALDLHTARRNIAQSRDELLEFYYTVSPEARAVRDYLKLHDELIAERVAAMKAEEGDPDES